MKIQKVKAKNVENDENVLKHNFNHHHRHYHFHRRHYYYYRRPINE